MSKKQKSREKRIRLVAISIIAALLLSLLAGALSFTPAPPASAAETKSVHISSADQELVDTDGDGLENNQDPDVDGDGIVNGEDPDIDGDGIENFDDADPIDTTDVDSNAPQKPVPQAGAGDTFVQSTAWIWISLSLVAASVISASLLAKRRKK